MIQANIDEKMDENERDAYSVGYSEGFDVGFQKGSEDTIKHLGSFTDFAIKIFIITSIIIGIILLGAMSVRGQQLPTISKSETVQTDTIPCFLQYRLPSGQSGIVKGWEVVKRGEKIEVCSMLGCTVYHGDIFEKARKAQSQHICYLRSDRRRFPKGTLIWKLQEPVKSK